MNNLRGIICTLTWIVSMVTALTPAFAQESQDKPIVLDARADLSNWNIAEDGPISLHGDWGFAWNQFLSFEALSTAPPPVTSTIPIPLQWTQQTESPRSTFGYATYFARLKLNTLAAQEQLSIISESVCCASRVEIWDEASRQLLARSLQGQPAISAENELTKMNLELHAVWDASRSSSLLVIIHISNHMHARPGILIPPRIELAADSSAQLLKQYILNASVAGILLIIALYHFVLFLQRRDDKLSLMFSLMCSSLLLRILITSTILDVFGFVNSPDGSSWMVRLEYFSTTLMGLTAALYVYELYPSKLLKLFIKYWSCLFGGALGLYIFIAPTVDVTGHLNVVIIQYLATLFAAVAFVAHAAFMQKNLARWMLLSFLIAGTGVINDALYATSIINTGYIVSYCFIMFILIQSGIIARTFARAMEERDASNQALLETYRQLDEELLNREKLITLNEHLEAEIKTASEQLIQADKMSTLGQLIAGVAHEIAGPTNYIGMATNLITKKVASVRTKLEQILDADNPEAVKILNIFTQELNEADTELERIDGGVGKIKEIHSALRNHGRIDPTPQLNVEIRPIIDETLVILGSKTKLIETVVSTENAPLFTGRRSQLGQVLTNLIGNAADATEELRLKNLEAGESFTSKLLIEAKAAEHDNKPHLEVAVHDNGSGIPEDIREKILEPFFTTKEVGKGTGLGMPIILRIIRGHHGDLVIEDSPELGGACLRFWIPIDPPNEQID